MFATNTVLSINVFNKIFSMKEIIAAGGLVYNEQGHLLLIFRRGKWDLPKGKADEGETIEATAIREVMEETGLQELELIKSLGITLHSYFDKWLQTDVIKKTHWFVMKANSAQPLIPQTEEDIEQIIWADAAIISSCMENSYKNIVEIIKRVSL